MPEIIADATGNFISVMLPMFFIVALMVGLYAVVHFRWYVQALLASSSVSSFCSVPPDSRLRTPDWPSPSPPGRSTSPPPNPPPNDLAADHNVTF
jgi:hypothetical protein